jgi:O-antigen ligase
MPLVAQLIHSSSVAPAAVIFLVLLCLSWLPVYLLKKGTFPVQAKVALFFWLAGLLSSGFSFFVDTPAYKDQSILTNAVSGIATFCLGILFYLLTSVMPHDNEKVKRTLSALNWGGGVMIVWTFAVFFISAITPGDTPDYLRVIQHVFSTTTFFGSRSVGFAAEPSWLAHILNMVYLPYWLGATISKFTAQKRKFTFLSVENILLVLGFATLFSTLSRAGLAAFLLVLGFFFIRLNIWAIRKLSEKWSSTTTKGLITAALIIGVLVIYVGAATGMVLVLSKVDPRMKEVFSFNLVKEGGILKYADVLQFGERFTYWQAGWRIFNAHPVFGVGLGNAGFYFGQMLPENAWTLSEVRQLAYHSATLMNIKSMWSRVLAETGIVGFSLFFLLLVVTGFTTMQLIHAKEPMRQAVGYMGIGMLIAFIIEGFSVDSFALPYLWFNLGLVAATWRWTTPIFTEK